MAMTLAVPFAVDEQQRLIRPADAQRHHVYWCLQCGHRVHFKPGKVRTAHFFHAHGSQCSGESVLHLAAKRALVEGLPGLTEVGLLLPCRHFDCREAELVVYPLPTFDQVQAEVTLGEYRLDVALLQAGKVVLAIEVYHTHRIGEAKGRDLPVPWIEVPARAVLENMQVFQPLVEETVTKADLKRVKPATPSLRWSAVQVFDLFTRWQDLLFQGRRSQQTVLPDPLCQTCEQTWQKELERRSMRSRVAEIEAKRVAGLGPVAWVTHLTVEEQRLESAARLRALDEDREQRARDHAARREEDLRRQRAKYGARLTEPLSRAAERLLDEQPRAIREALTYLRAELRDFSVLEGRMLVVKDCQKCGVRLVHIDTAEYFGTLGVYGRLLRYWKKPGAGRGWVFNVCQACGEWQKRDTDGLSWRSAISIDGYVFLEVLRAFGQLPPLRRR